MPAELIRGPPVADALGDRVRSRIRILEELGVDPTLATILMSDDPMADGFMDSKHSACASAGVSTIDVRLDPTDSAERLYDAIDRLCGDPDVHAVFVQVPLPEHVSMARVRRHMDPSKDIDCFYPENLGRLVADDPRFVPATPAAVCVLLGAYDVPVAGRDVVVVGRSTVIGKPIAILLGRDAPLGNATVTVCHSRTEDLASVTRRADMVVTAAGVPELVNGPMIREGATVIDVSSMRRPEDDGCADPSDAGGQSSATVVGDVEFESAKAKAEAIAPVPGGVGPVTLATILYNVVRATELAVDSVRTDPLPPLPTVDPGNLE
ncbi:MAG: bifunctional 5,10-methylenetetrahydrofolate dehydrogenase/5,10-methenyltetrahydrofolate cyclohydrolase [Natronomonas sp.]